MDWGASGIRNTYEFERVGFDLETSLGFVEDVVSGEISENYDGDYRTCLQVDVDGEPLPLTSLLRVWHVSELGGESVREELGTYMLQPDSQQLDYEQGRYTGRASLQSVLYGLDTDLRGRDTSIAGTAVVIDTFTQKVSQYGYTPALAYQFQGSTRQWGSAHVWERGESVLDECQRCADALGGYVTVDTHGRVLLDAYTTPTKRPNTWTLTADDYVDGVGLTQGDIVNYVSVAFTYEDGNGKQRTLIGTAGLDKFDPYGWKSIGRWSSANYEIASLADQTQAGINAVAQQYLRAASTATRTFSLTMPYAPIPCGSVGIVEVGGLVTRAVVSTRSIDLDTAGLMQLGLKEIA